MADDAVGRLADLTIALSLATDLGTGQPMEHGLRTCCLALATADALGLEADERSCVYYTALLRFVGCTADASETAAAVGGDDVGFNAAMGPMLLASQGEAARHVVRHLGEGLPLPRRAALLARALADTGAERRSLSAHCEVGARLAAQLGMPEPVRRALAHAYERWDGGGHPAGLAGEEVPLAIRIVSVARDAELWARRAGWPAAVEVLLHRRGRAYDPAVVDAVAAGGEGWLSDAGDDLCGRVLDREPPPRLTVDEAGLDRALLAVAWFADAKSPWFRGRATGVSALAGAAARLAGLPEGEAVLAGRAALVHDLGRVGVASGIWDRPGPLTADQWERVRLHAYLSERALLRCDLLAPLAGLAGRHHERPDGSGYHRGLAEPQLGVAAQVLGAADAYHAMTEARPHRPALSPSAAASQLVDDADAGRYARGPVEAVLAAAGQAARPANVARPAGLTEREVDVLRLVARGRTNKEVAAALGISRKTVGRHVEHIYAKAGVATRAGAALFAMEHDLLTP